MSKWKRKGLYYVAMEYTKTAGMFTLVQHKLDLVSYHLIRLIHGQEKLEQMARKYSE